MIHDAQTFSAAEPGSSSWNADFGQVWGAQRSQRSGIDHWNGTRQERSFYAKPLGLHRSSDVFASFCERM